MENESEDMGPSWFEIPLNRHSMLHQIEEKRLLMTRFGLKVLNVLHFR